jgi:hypothetical protein
MSSLPKITDRGVELNGFGISRSTDGAHVDLGPEVGVLSLRSAASSENSQPWRDSQYDIDHEIDGFDRVKIVQVV